MKLFQFSIWLCNRFCWLVSRFLIHNFRVNSWIRVLSLTDCLMLWLLETIRSLKTESNGIGFVVFGCSLRARRRTAAIAVFFVSGDARRGRRTKGGLGTKEASLVLLCIRNREETNSNHDVWPCFRLAGKRRRRRFLGSRGGVLERPGFDPVPTRKSTRVWS